MFWTVVAYLVFSGLIAHIDFALLKGVIGTTLSTYMPWNHYKD